MYREVYAPEGSIARTQSNVKQVIVDLVSSEGSNDEAEVPETLVNQNGFPAVRDARVSSRASVKSRAMSMR